MSSTEFSVRGSSPFGYTDAANYSPDNYGRIVEGNSDLSYGPWIDPEIQRFPHRAIMTNRKRRLDMNGRVGF